MRLLDRGIAYSALLALLISPLGCSGGDLKEGVPEDVDMTKSYAPAASVDMMKPGDQKKAGNTSTTLAPVP
jgi:hypothetical protein